MASLPKKIGDAIENFRFREASQKIISLARLGNKYLADAEPWKLIKTDPERVKTIMNTALQISCGLSILCEPLLPFTSVKLKNMLNLDQKTLGWDAIETKKTLLQPKHLLGKTSLLFQLIDNLQMDTQREKLKKSTLDNYVEEKNLAPLKPKTLYKDFDTLNIQVGEIIQAKKVEKTKKLMKLTVRLDEEELTVVSGIAKDFDEEELIGKKVSLLVNLKPRKLKGIDSQGMILLGENSKGDFVFIGPEDKSIPSGTRIK
jgi:methionyl-tRNA synthetase